MTKETEPHPQPAGTTSSAPAHQVVRYLLLVACVIAQAVTLAMTWPLWQLRDHPPHLPLVDVPQVPFGWLLMASLVAMLILPKVGVWLHVAILLVSFAFDQFRTQPQFIAIAVLMLAAVDQRATVAARWFLVSLWLWAGLHKLLSPEWFGFRAWNLVERLGLEAEPYFLAFALVVALSEISVGLVAAVRPRMAGCLCVLIHGGIVLFLSPWGIDWNYSVIPWNLCSAVVGCWILLHTGPGLPASRLEGLVAALLLLLPIGFYSGHVDHGVASVLYSDNLPRALISSKQNNVEIQGWGKLRVPFPNERRLFRIYFAQAAEPGAKLHISDPRPWLADLYYLKTADRGVVELTPERFFDSRTGSAGGVGLDRYSSIFALTRAGARLLKRTPKSMVYAVEIPPASYDAALLEHLTGLPNVEQLQLAGCPVRDQDLLRLTKLYKLVGVGLDDTFVTDEGLGHLATQPVLDYVEHRNTEITAAAIERLGFGFDE